jgi:hypothetical protein
VLAEHCSTEGRPFEAIEKAVNTRLEPGKPAAAFVERAAAQATLGLDHLVVLTRDPGPPTHSPSSPPRSPTAPTTRRRRRPRRPSRPPRALTMSDLTTLLTTSADGDRDGGSAITDRLLSGGGPDDQDTGAVARDGRGRTTTCVLANLDVPERVASHITRRGHSTASRRTPGATTTPAGRTAPTAE